MRIGRLLTALMVACALAMAGCGTGSESSTPLSPGAARTTPDAPPDRCADQPVGRAQDGVNDEQGGSNPGVQPCDGPGH
jgi:hypothetical protein